MTAQYSVYFILALSTLSLVAAFFFARRVIGSDTGMQRVAVAVKAGAGALMQRQYKTIAALLMMVLPSLAYGQGEPAGEASLKLPDLSVVHHFGLNGPALLMVGLLFCVGGLLFGMTIFVQLKNLPVHKSMREMSELIYETCKTYLVTQGKFIMLLWVFIAVILSRSISAGCRQWAMSRLRSPSSCCSAWSALPAAMAWRGSEFASTPLPTPAWHSPD